MEFSAEFRVCVLAVRSCVQRRPTYKVSFGGGKAPPDLRFRGPLEAKSSVWVLKSALSGPREGSSILNVDLAVVTARRFPAGPKTMC